MEGAEVGVVQLVAVLASSAVKKDTGLEIAPTLALGVEQGVVGEGKVVVGAGVLAMGAQQEGIRMGVHKGREGAVMGLGLLHLEPVTSVGSLAIGQTAAQTDRFKHVTGSSEICSNGV